MMIFPPCNKIDSCNRLFLILFLSFSVIGNICESKIRRFEKPIELAEPNALSTANNEFTLNVLKQIVDGQKLSGKGPVNTISSPFNVAQVLAMIMLGAKAQTLNQIKSTLKLNDESLAGMKLHDKLSEVYRQLARADNVTLELGNGVYPDLTFPIDKKFKENLIKMYNAVIQNLNYKKDPRGAEKTINENVAKATKDRIKNLLPPNSLNDQTRLVLTSAIYFKGKWENPFNESLTKPKSFHMDDGKVVQIPMMNAKDSAAYYGSNVTTSNGQLVDVLRLDYTNRALSLYVVLPPKNGLATLIANLNAKGLYELSKKLFYARNLDISVPTFKINYSAEMKEILQKLGMKDIFDRQADLSGMVAQTPGKDREQLYVNEIYHKAFIEVNEKGSEAAAASGAVIMLMSMPFPKSFIADRPFLYYIMDRASGNILFIGTFVSPSAK